MWSGAAYLSNKSRDRFQWTDVPWITDTLPVILAYCGHIKKQSCILRGPNDTRQYRCWPEYMTRLNYWLTLSEGHLNVSLRQKIDEAAAPRCILMTRERMDYKYLTRVHIICRFARHKLLSFVLFECGTTQVYIVPLPSKMIEYKF